LWSIFSEGDLNSSQWILVSSRHQEPGATSCWTRRTLNDWPCHGHTRGICPALEGKGGLQIIVKGKWRAPGLQSRKQQP